MSLLIYLSIDNMLAAFGLGVLAPNAVRRTTVCSAFFAAEAGAALSGAMLRNTWFGHSAHLFEPAIMPLYGLFGAIFLIRAIANSTIGLVGTLWVALLLSLDNFIASASGQTDFSLLTSVLLPAIVSGVTALPALEAGRFLSIRLRRLWNNRLINAPVSNQSA